jgi:integrase
LASDVVAWTNELVTEDLAPQTVRNNYRVLSRILDRAVRFDAIRSNPCAGLADELPPLRSTSGDRVFLTAGEVARAAQYLGENEDPQLRVFVLMAVDTGWRFGELIGLRVEDFNELHSRLRLRGEDGNVTFANGKWHSGPPKGRSGERNIRLSSFVAGELSGLVAGRDAPDLVFTNRKDGGHLPNHAVADPVRRAAIRTLPQEKAHLRLHDLRHTAASLLVAGGANVVEVANRLGHANPTITLNTYTHLFKDHDDALAANLDRIWREATDDPEDGSALGSV